jgi:SAM-dependent methyltransferase
MNQSGKDRAVATKALMPSPEVYEQEYKYWPWGILINKTTELIQLYADHSSHILEYMCGTGYLLNEISQRRPDLRLFGCSLNPDYIDYAHHKYSQIGVVLQDALRYKPIDDPDIVICTAGLHHLTKKDQKLFIQKLASELKKGKLLFLGEEVIRPFSDEEDRKLAVLELWTRLISFALSKGATQQVIRAASDAMTNDLFEQGEYKLCLRELENLISPYFLIETVEKTWYEDSLEHGDVLLTCKRL